MNLQHNVNLQGYNTFGIHATASRFVAIESPDQLVQTLQQPAVKEAPLFVLGGGSNILLTQNIEALVLHMAIKGITFTPQGADHVLVHAGAGESWHALVLHCLERGYGGIENLSLIPGTVGAAPMQNIGAYGVEIKDVFHSLEAVEISTGKTATFNAQQCQFGYRESIFKRHAKGQYIITRVTLRLTTSQHHINTSYGAINDTLAAMGVSQPTIQQVSQAVIHIRESKLPNPAQIGNAGSFFKNPVVDKLDHEALKAEFGEVPGYAQPNGQTIKVPAAWLIDQCGWKGHRRGPIGVHDKQPLVLVNHSNGVGKDLYALAMDIRTSVAQKFGIELTPEVNII